jgi:hypothetical protein
MATIVAITASSSHSTGPVQNLIDGDRLSSHWTNNGGTTGWVVVQLSAAETLTWYEMTPTTDTPSRNPSAWVWEGSNDNATWTTLDTRSGVAWSTSPLLPQTFTFSNATAYLYYRLNISAAQAGENGYCSFCELDVTRYVHAPVASEFYWNEPPRNAVDSNPGTFWTTNGSMAAWLRLDFDIPVAKGDYVIYPRSATNTERNPKTWTWEGSNDAISWTVLDTQTNYTWTLNQYHTFACANTTPYRYYRINITLNQNGSGYTSLAEIYTVDSIAATIPPSHARPTIMSRVAVQRASRW